MEERIKPFDIIRITEAVKATLIVHYHAPFTDAVEVQIAPDMILYSSVHNYAATDEYIFSSQKDKHTILKLFNYVIPDESKFDCSFKIAASDIIGKFAISKRFDYKDLNPDLHSHVFLMANLYFFGNQQEVSTEKWNCFVYNFMPLQEILNKYNDMLITSDEAINSIASEIQKQVYSAKNRSDETNFPKISGKIDLSDYDKLNEDSIT